MHPTRLAALAFTVLAAASCSKNPNPAPVIPVDAATKEDRSALVGKWTGTYISADTGRSGSIVFELKKGEKAEAQGDVLMWPKGSKDVKSPSEVKALPEDQLKTMPQILTISFVESQGGVVTGTIDPYLDPDCGCQVRTTFGGTIDGDVIVGDFTIERFDDPGKKARGNWKVTRQKA
ncbi:MAG TPA: hypothetical protein VIB08_00830 [Thermoanaerobaculia bacterium]